MTYTVEKGVYSKQVKVVSDFEYQLFICHQQANYIQGTLR